MVTKARPVGLVAHVNEGEVLRWNSLTPAASRHRACAQTAIFCRFRTSFCLVFGPFLAGRPTSHPCHRAGRDFGPSVTLMDAARDGRIRVSCFGKGYRDTALGLT